jgi:hypothetical protein
MLQFQRDAACAGLAQCTQDTVIDLVNRLETQSDMTDLITHLVRGELR